MPYRPLMGEEIWDQGPPKGCFPRIPSRFPGIPFRVGGCGGVFPKDSMIIFPSRWLAGAASERKRGDVHCAAWPPDPRKPLDSLGKQAFLQNRSFASKDGWDRVLRPLVDVLGPLRRGQGEWVHSSGGHLGPLGGSGSIHLVSIVWMTGSLGGHEPGL